MVTMTTKIAIMTLSIVLLTCVCAKAQETKSQEDVTYRIEFLSKNFPDAWVKVASQISYENEQTHSTLIAIFTTSSCWWIHSATIH